MSTATAFLELKRLLTGIESTSQKLKANVNEGKSSKYFVGVEGDDFVDSLEKNVLSVQSRLDVIEVNICGTAETRLSQITMVEILQKCKTLHLANEAMIMAVESHMVDYGYTPIPVISNIESDKKEEPIPTIKGKVAEAEITDMKNENENEWTVVEVEIEAVPEAFLESCDILDEKHSVLPVLTEEFEENQYQNSDENENPEDNTRGNIDENSTYHSPKYVKKLVEKGSEHEVKTPALPDWRLSEATRMLVLNKEGKEGKDGKEGRDLRDGREGRERDGIRGRVQSSYQPSNKPESTPVSTSNTYSHPSDDNTPKTPSNMNLTCVSMNQSRYNNNHTTHITDNTHIDGSFTFEEAEMLTPQPVIGTAYKKQQNDDSPLTPCFGTPFHTTRLRNIIGAAESPDHPKDVKVKLARTLALSPDTPEYNPSTENDRNNRNNGIDRNDSNSSNNGAMLTTHTNNNNNVNNDSDSPTTPYANREKENKINFKLSPDEKIVPKNDPKPASKPVSKISPPKMAILAPRPGGAKDMRGGNIALFSVISTVTAEEWETAPAFLRKQTSTEILNTAVININKFIAQKDDVDSGSNSITLSEMEKIIPSKPVVLGLVHLKRLDIGSIDGVKVYKVKRI